MLNCFYCITQYHHFQSSTIDNNNFLYLLWHSKLTVNQSSPYLYFRKVLLVSSFHQSGAWQACAQQTKKNRSHTTSAVSCEVYVHAPLVQHLYSAFFNVWFGIVQHQKQVGCREGRKIGHNMPILQS